MTKTKYYNAIGSVTTAALSKMLQDILGLSDITELESRRLSELCRIFNALEGLFTEDSRQVFTFYILIVWMNSKLIPLYL